MPSPQQLPSHDVPPSVSVGGTSLLRAVRAALFTAVNTTLGLTAHHLSTEQTPRWQPAAAAAAALFVLALAIPVARRSRAITLSACAAAQIALHLWLSRPGGSDAGPHAHHLVTAAGGPSPHDAWHQRLHHSTAMTLAHVAAAVLVAVALHGADTAPWQTHRRMPSAVGSVATILRAWWHARTMPPPAAPPAPVPAGSGERCALTDKAVLTHVLVRRGPPDVAGLTA